jgi:DNA-directed RNA polymerase omega subunit
MNVKDDTTLINGIMNRIPNKYMAVIVASRRARAITDGLTPSVKTGATKPTTMALEEIASGGISIERIMLEEPPERKKKEELMPPIVPQEVYVENEDEYEDEDEEEEE